ncbi:MAG TPA: GNAT family N-acetyltransferase [Bacteroidia bacterium]|jgi:RimJ/RimL family protein N-acetyltransferase|nr:GNAT family N-acetyltransferase [Bacteroidia bacterium]
MLSNTPLETERLQLNPLDISDAAFISELVNTKGWIRFIGERNVRTPEEAQAYVQKLMSNPAIHYKVVRLKETKSPLGIITFIKREYLDHPDIGFAFLPSHNKQGYAYEASQALLLEISKNTSYTQILATTVPENTSSIRLLEKLGLKFSNAITADGTGLHVYSASLDTFPLDFLTKEFFSIFTNTNNKQPDWDLIRRLCLPEAQIIKKAGDTQEVYTLQSFISPRRQILSDGTLTDFEEKEMEGETKIIGSIAQRFSRYQKSGKLRGKSFHEYGNKLFQFVKTKEGWKISSLVWEDDPVKK